MLRSATLLFLFLSSTTWSQVMTKGRFGITPYIGLPSASRATTRDLGFGYGDYGNSDFRITGPAVELGIKAEYLLTNVIGIALEANYEKAGYDYTYYGYDETGMQLQEYNQSWSQTKIRGLLRMQFHVLKSDKVDLYPGFGLGFCSRTYQHPENTPEIDDYGIFIPIVFLDRITDPVAARIFFGANFMFTRNIGLNTELGMGAGSVLKLGLAIYLGRQAEDNDGQ